MTKGDEERLKLTANFLNILAAGTIITGGIAPFVSAIFRTSNVSMTGAAFGSAFRLGIGFVLHFLARSLLRRLDT